MKGIIDSRDVKAVVGKASHLSNDEINTLIETDRKCEENYCCRCEEPLKIWKIEQLSPLCAFDKSGKVVSYMWRSGGLVLLFCPECGEHYHLKEEWWHDQRLKLPRRLRDMFEGRVDELLNEWVIE